MATKRKRPISKPSGKKSRAPSRRPVKGGKRASVRAKTAKGKPTRKPAAASTSRAAGDDQVRALARRIVELTVAQDDEASFAFYADNVESVEPGMPPVFGIDAIRQKFQMWRGMVSDSSWEARNLWVDGNTIIIEWSGQATLIATGKRTTLDEVAIHEVADGKIVRERFYYDRSALQP